MRPSIDKFRSLAAWGLLLCFSMFPTARSGAQPEEGSLPGPGQPGALLIRRSYIPLKQSHTPEEAWLHALDHFPPEAHWTEEDKTKARGAFLSANADAMPPEWRLAFLKNRLWWAQVSGDWGAMIAIRDALMKSDIDDSARSVLDADLLLQIAQYFTNLVFAPPPGTPGASSWEERMEGAEKTQDEKKIRFEYWMKNYRNEEEAAGIYGYVITHFDSEYVVSRIADYRLAGVEVQLRKERQALDRLKALRASEGEPLHGAARFDHGSRRMVTAEEHLKEEMEALEVWKKQTPQAMFRAARGLAKDEKLTEHIELVNGYPDDAELQRLIKSDLTRKQAESATADENRALIQAIRQEPSRN